MQPQICLHGLKMAADSCDFSFECSSRCCIEGTCSHPMKCHERCERNDDCSKTNGACCSEGFCTDVIVCQGNKAPGDYCDVGSECLTRYCKKDTTDGIHRNTCEKNNSIATAEPDSYLWVLIIIVILLVVTIVVICLLWLKGVTFR